MSRNEEFDLGRVGRQFEGVLEGISEKTGERVRVPLNGRIVDETDTHLTIQRPRSRTGEAKKVTFHKGLIVSDTSPKPRVVNRRSNEDRDSDRGNLLNSIGEEWMRIPEGTNPSDVQHLVRHGHIESEVREESDKQKGKHSSGFFGSAGVVKRRRMYVRRVQNPGSGMP